MCDINSSFSTGIDPKTINQLNDLIAQSSESILCPPGSDCDKKKSTQDLYKKYLDAQSNVRTAPNQLQLAEKNYYTYSLGEPGYNKYEDTELGNQADKIINEKKTEFNKNSNLVKKLSININSLIANLQNVTELYNNYIDENSKLKEEIIQSGSDVGTNDRKTYYEDQSINNLHFYYFIMIILYIIILIVFAVFIFVFPSDTHRKTHIIMLVFLIIYPFISTWLLLFVIKMLSTLF